MSKSKVALVARVQIHPGDYHTPRVAVAYHPNGRPKTDAAIIGGKEVPVVCVRNFYIRWTEGGKRQVENVGNDPIAAVRTAERKDPELRAKKFGIAVQTPASVAAPTPSGRVRFADAVKEYLDEIREHKRPKTYHAYRRALETFQAGCKVEYVDEIGRPCVMAFKAACQREYESAFTVKNFFAYVIAFLNRYGRRGLVSKTDWPKPEANEYDPRARTISRGCSPPARRRRSACSSCCRRPLRRRYGDQREPRIPDRRRKRRTQFLAARAVSVSPAPTKKRTSRLRMHDPRSAPTSRKTSTCWRKRSSRESAGAARLMMPSATGRTARKTP
ncbi:MAG: hypothetical protein ACLP3K_11500 [Candidatus Acidiferrales bacterium]